MSPRQSEEPEITLHYPPLPELVWNGQDWQTTLKLHSWAAYRLDPISTTPRKKPAKAGVRVKKNTGEVALKLHHPGLDGPIYLPTAAQIAAVIELQANERTIHDLVAKKLLAHVNREFRHLPSDVELPEGVSRSKLSLKSLTRLVELRSVHIEFDVDQTRAAVGFDLACAWDDEHGAGVRLLGKKVIKIGHASVGFDL